MKHRFTTFDLVRFLYQEVSYMERIAIQKALKSDTALAEEFEQLQAGSSMLNLNELELAPSALSIQNILNYSSSSRLEKEHS